MSGGIFSLLAAKPLFGIKISFRGGQVFHDGASCLTNVDRVDVSSPLVLVLIRTLSISGHEDFDLLPIKPFYHRWNRRSRRSHNSPRGIRQHSSGKGRARGHTRCVGQSHGERPQPARLSSKETQTVSKALIYLARGLIFPLRLRGLPQTIRPCYNYLYEALVMPHSCYERGIFIASAPRISTTACALARNITLEPHRQADRSASARIF